MCQVIEPLRTVIIIAVRGRVAKIWRTKILQERANARRRGFDVANVVDEATASGNQSEGSVVARARHCF